MHKNVFRVNNSVPKISPNHRKTNQVFTKDPGQFYTALCVLGIKIWHFVCYHRRLCPSCTTCSHADTWSCINAVSLFIALQLFTQRTTCGLCRTLWMKPCFLFSSPVGLAFLVPLLQASSPEHSHALWILVAVVSTSLLSPRVLLALLQ